MKKYLVMPILAMAALIVLSGADKSSHPSSKLIFDHNFHVKEAGVECAQCHAGVESSTSGRERFIPDMDVCASCHDVESESGCVTCHPDPNNIVPHAQPNGGYESFNHKLHTAKLTCDKCHAVQAGAATKGNLYPMMRDCATCHSSNRVDPTCLVCHTAGMPASPASHKVNWQERHGEEAAFAQAECAMCHEAPGAPSTCTKCHQGTEFGSPHPRNFVHSTAMIRAGGLADCQSCHEAESFCATCHMQKMVLPMDHSRPGWATPKPSMGGTHARKGNSDLESCVICHASMAQQPTCFSAGCHQ